VYFHDFRKHFRSTHQSNSHNRTADLQGNLFTKVHLVKLFLYLAFQLIGGVLGALFTHYAFKINIPYCPLTDHIMDVFFAESFFSGTLVFVTLLVISAFTRPNNKNYVNLGFVAIWLYLIINAGATSSGGCYNPTVYLIMNGLAYFKGFNATFDRFFVYFLSPYLETFIFYFLFYLSL
jgi:glycerol uptake facilitator-like aquaporin